MLVLKKTVTFRHPEACQGEGHELHCGPETRMVVGVPGWISVNTPEIKLPVNGILIMQGVSRDPLIT